MVHAERLGQARAPVAAGEDRILVCRASAMLALLMTSLEVISEAIGTLVPGLV